MWQIPIYLNLAPIITIATALLFSVKFKKYFLGPFIIFIIFNIPTVILPFYVEVDWRGLFGWSVFYTLIASIISFYTWFVRLRRK